MKRKLDENDVPVPAEEIKVAAKEAATFDSFGLDSRILQGIAKQKWQSPTPVQTKAIPLALEGRHILARAKTGSGKTAAYLLPIIQSILRRKQSDTTKCISALILVPTRELAEQVSKTLDSLVAFCSNDVKTLNLTQKVSAQVQRTLLDQSPDIVVATPAGAATHFGSSTDSLEKLLYLAIDEADLVLSYGYEDDLSLVAKTLPKGVQTILMSATLTSDVETLKGLFCINPAVLKLEETEAEGEGVSQYVVKCAEDEKFLLIYVIFKLKLVKGKCIIFVADIDRCYRLKLYLEQFGTKSCILNSELPVNSRLHVVDEFNKGVYDIIIASDEHEVLGDEDEPKQQKLQEEEPEQEPEDKQVSGDEVDKVEKVPAKEPAKKKRKTAKKDRDYGVSRGIDFVNVACVLNFDLPTSSKSYTHRIGRTARAGQTGMALSFVIPTELYRKHKPTTVASAKDDEKVLAKIIKHQAKKGKEVKPYNFDMKQVDAFRYRMSDALRAVTGVAVRESRTKELRQELIKSEKLKRHFEENPGDLHHLRHDGELRPARVQSHLKHVPDYLLPKEGRKAISGEIGFIGIKSTSENRRKNRMGNGKARGKKPGARRSDPLKTFKPKSRKVTSAPTIGFEISEASSDVTKTGVVDPVPVVITFRIRHLLMTLIKLDESPFLPYFATTQRHITTVPNLPCTQQYPHISTTKASVMASQTPNSRTRVARLREEESPYRTPQRSKPLKYGVISPSKQRPPSDIAISPHNYSPQPNSGGGREDSSEWPSPDDHVVLHQSYKRSFTPEHDMAPDLAKRRLLNYHPTSLGYQHSQHEIQGLHEHYGQCQAVHQGQVAFGNGGSGANTPYYLTAPNPQFALGYSIMQPQKVAMVPIAYAPQPPPTQQMVMVPIKHNSIFPSHQTTPSQASYTPDSVPCGHTRELMSPESPESPQGAQNTSGNGNIQLSSPFGRSSRGDVTPRRHKSPIEPTVYGRIVHQAGHAPPGREVEFAYLDLYPNTKSCYPIRGSVPRQRSQHEQQQKHRQQRGWIADAIDSDKESREKSTAPKVVNHFVYNDHRQIDNRQINQNNDQVKVRDPAPSGYVPGEHSPIRHDLLISLEDRQRLTHTFGSQSRAPHTPQQSGEIIQEVESIIDGSYANDGGHGNHDSGPLPSQRNPSVHSITTTREARPHLLHSSTDQHPETNNLEHVPHNQKVHDDSPLMEALFRRGTKKTIHYSPQNARNILPKKGLFDRHPKHKSTSDWANDQRRNLPESIRPSSVSTKEGSPDSDIDSIQFTKSIPMKQRLAPTPGKVVSSVRAKPAAPVRKRRAAFPPVWDDPVDTNMARQLRAAHHIIGREVATKQADIDALDKIIFGEVIGESWEDEKRKEAVEARRVARLQKEKELEMKAETEAAIAAEQELLRRQAFDLVRRQREEQVVRDKARRNDDRKKIAASEAIALEEKRKMSQAKIEADRQAEAEAKKAKLELAARSLEVQAEVADLTILREKQDKMRWAAAGLKPAKVSIKQTRVPAADSSIAGPEDLFVQDEPDEDQPYDVDERARGKTIGLHETDHPGPWKGRTKFKEERAKFEQEKIHTADKKRAEFLRQRLDNKYGRNSLPPAHSPSPVSKTPRKQKSKEVAVTRNSHSLSNEIPPSISKVSSYQSVTKPKPVVPNQRRKKTEEQSEARRAKENEKVRTKQVQKILKEAERDGFEISVEEVQTRADSFMRKREEAQLQKKNQTAQKNAVFGASISSYVPLPPPILVSPSPSPPKIPTREENLQAMQDALASRAHALSARVEGERAAAAATIPFQAGEDDSEESKESEEDPDDDVPQHRPIPQKAREDEVKDEAFDLEAELERALEASFAQSPPSSEQENIKFDPDRPVLLRIYTISIHPIPSTHKQSNSNKSYLNLHTANKAAYKIFSDLYPSFADISITYPSAQFHGYNHESKVRVRVENKVKMSNLINKTDKITDYETEIAPRLPKKVYTVLLTIIKPGVDETGQPREITTAETVAVFTELEMANFEASKQLLAAIKPKTARQDDIDIYGKYQQEIWSARDMATGKNELFNASIDSEDMPSVVKYLVQVSVSVTALEVEGPRN